MTKLNDIGNYKHDGAKRTMIPTAEQQGFVQEEEALPIKLRYPRNADLDPQLVWRGKDAEDIRDLYVDAPPVYIQEKIHPRAIIERLKRETATRREAVADMPNLFADFNGRPNRPEARTEFYQHEQNWQNRMILGDALMVMASLGERENLRGKVQCIFMDPPYGIKFNSNWQASTGSRDVKDGIASHISREPEVVRAFRDTWKDGVNTYLSYLRDRLTLAKDLLSETGSIFVQIGDENVHRVRALMDEVFGESNFCALITFQKTGSIESDFIGTTCDFLIWYALDKSKAKYHQLFEARDPSEKSLSRYDRVEINPFEFRPITPEEKVGKSHTDENTRIQFTSLLSDGKSEADASFSFRGNSFKARKGNHWKTTIEGLRRLDQADRVVSTESYIRYKRKVADFNVVPISDRWESVQIGTGLIYVVQSSVEVVKRCILMTTDPGDLVLDPTCGSGTTAFVAEQWGRRWITIDTSRVALTLSRARIMGAKYPYYLLRDTDAGLQKEAELTGVSPHSERLAEVRRHKHNPDLALGFIYRRVPHIQLRDIAGNLEIDDLWEEYNPAVVAALKVLNEALSGHDEPLPVTRGWRSGTTIDFRGKGNVEFPSGENGAVHDLIDWEVPRFAPEHWPAAARDALGIFWEARLKRQSAIDESIEREGNRNAQFLYDQPFEDKKITRVAGPFTVESLSPYRVIPSDDDPRLLGLLHDEHTDLPRRLIPREQTDFAHVVMEHLKSAGVQNTKKDERLEFDSIQPWPGKGYVSFEGRYEERGATRRAAIAIGPEYDAVGYEFVRNAAREAKDVFDILVVCGFQFSPEVDDSMLNFGRLKVLKARMNQDIRMGDKLKNTGAGNLFVVFGEPDIAVSETREGMLQVEIKGVDIFDPTTGEVKSSDDPAEDIACWFIDDSYDQESFFVRQAYFLGGAAGDPYKALKRSLKTEVDVEAWSTLSRTISYPFVRPTDGLICVKVINHFGDEVQKVFKV